MFRIFVLLRAKDSSNAPFIEDCLKQVSAVTLAEEPCCRRLDVYHSDSDPAVFMLNEEWEAKTDWEDHRSRRAFQEIYQTKVLPLVEREPHISTLITE